MTSSFLVSGCLLMCVLSLPLAGYAADEKRNASVLDTKKNQVSVGSRIALVIGNGDYRSIGTLKNPVNDANDIAAALKEFGFTVIKITNASRREMTEKLEEFSRKLEGASVALIYYAGHGVQIQNENYLLPIDVSAGTEASIKYDSIPMGRILAELDEGNKNRLNIIILDACRNNPITGRFRSVQRGLAAPSSTPKGTVVVYATDPGNTADDGDGRNGIFTSGLLKAFKGNDLSLDGVLTVASAEVEEKTNNRQTPYVNGPKTIQKQFYFNITVVPDNKLTESQFWDSIKNSSDVNDFEAYLEEYPKGSFKKLAENRLRLLKKQEEALKLPKEPLPAVVNPPPIIRPQPQPQPQLTSPPSSVSSRYSQVPKSNGDTYNLTECVKDNATGLVWEGKTTDGSLHDTKNKYTNLQDNSQNDSSALKNATNAEKLCGYSDWRMPTKEELEGIVLKGAAPTINKEWFVNTQPDVYWSSSYSNYMNSLKMIPTVWEVDFDNGKSYYTFRDNPYHVRLVRP